MEILIHDERPDEPKVLPDGIVSKVYKTDIRGGGTKLIDMVSGERYSVVLTNDGYEEVDLDQHSGTNASCLSAIRITGDVMRKWTKKWIAILESPSEH